IWPVRDILQQRCEKNRPGSTLCRLTEAPASRYFHPHERKERFCFQNAYFLRRSGIGLAVDREQRIRFAHFPPGGVQQGFDHAVFKENPLCVLPSSIEIAARTREQTENQGDVERFGGE